MVHMTHGLLRLKYPKRRLIEEHLSPSRPLGKTLREAAVLLALDYGHKRLTLTQLGKYATVEGVSIDKLVRIMWDNRQAKVRDNNTRPVKKEDIKKICRVVMRKLGPSHTEQVYELALCQELYNRRIPHVRQMPVSVRYDPSTSIPAGIIDVEVDHRILIELKTGGYSDRHRQQLGRYIQAQRSNGRQIQCAMVVCFENDGSVGFHCV